MLTVPADLDTCKAQPTMKADAKFTWLLQQSGSVAEMSLLQVMVIACHHGAKTIDGRVFPPFHVWLTPAEIARRSGLHERTVPEIVERLKQRGLIAPAGRHGKTGQIRVHRLLIDAAESAKEPAPLKKAESAKVSSPLKDRERPKDSSPLKAAAQSESPSLSASKDEPFCIPLIEERRDLDVKERDQRSAPKRRIPDDWRPSEKLTAWAREKRPDLVDLEAVTERFRDYYLSKGEARASWDASFRTWVGREKAPAKQQITRQKGFDQMDYRDGIGPRGELL